MVAPLAVTEKRNMSRITWCIVILATGLVAKAQDKVNTDNPNCAPRSAALEGQPIFAVAEKMPQFPGGKAALQQFFANHVQVGTAVKPLRGIMVDFVIDTTGQVVNFCISKHQMQAPTPLEADVLRVVQLLPKWIPGVQGSRKVPVRYSYIVKL